MDPHGQLARRFPLVSRFRPACLPLPDRVHTLVTLADSAAAGTDQGLASAVYNQAALIASDVGLPDLARQMCHQHADAYLHATPLPAMTAIRALEPVVNLARLQIRAGHPDDGLDRLLRLSEAVSNGTADRFDDVHVPADLVQTEADRQEVRAWLWRVLLADGSRTLTGAGRWAEALAHTREHQGIGKRMFDGRQIAVVAALTSGDTSHAAELIAETAAGDPWEHAITACLHALCHRASDGLGHAQENELEAAVLAVPVEQGMTVFDTRLRLTALATIASPASPAAQRITNQLHRHITNARDGFAAREALADPLFTKLAPPTQLAACRDLVEACALGSGAIPVQLRRTLDAALQRSDRVIRDSLSAS
ncbi:hypothetical protein OG304_06155 [Streptomyces sp. NBC_00160]|uniref:hypothetical protein n=1 Tax=Streptomyces sp. NBC_00160 TaxID=2903628 RepID=UPI002251A652|nr:hypothetical protein [Streptomyces sp. NBC_00160]MCX5303034.1 hypothetical protein [Streptomyces sp. NBC_00160]